MNKLLKKIVAGALVFATVLTFTGCNKKEEGTPWFNPDGTLKALTKKELDSSGEGNYYIKRGDNYYRLLDHGMSGLEGNDENGGKKKIIWYTEKYEKYYPTLKKGDEIVFTCKARRPSETSFTYYEDCGYTIGTSFSKKVVDTGTEIGLSGKYCPDSPIQSYIDSGIPVKSDVRIMKINEAEFSPHMLDTDGFLHDLQMNKVYKLWFYMGTVYSSVTTKADTHLYKQIGKVSTSSYIENADSYFTLVLPEMPNGFYSINGHGWFLYNDEENKILPETIVEEISKQFASEEEAIANSTTDDTYTPADNSEDNPENSETTVEDNTESQPQNSESSASE